MQNMEGITSEEQDPYCPPNIARYDDTTIKYCPWFNCKICQLKLPTIEAANEHNRTPCRQTPGPSNKEGHSSTRIKKAIPRTSVPQQLYCPPFMIRHDNSSIEYCPWYMCKLCQMVFISIEDAEKHSKSSCQNSSQGMSYATTGSLITQRETVTSGQNTSYKTSVTRFNTSIGYSPLFFCKLCQRILLTAKDAEEHTLKSCKSILRGSRSQH